MKNDEIPPDKMILIGAEEVTLIARGLSHLAGAFERTGNATVAKELDNTAEQLTKVAKMVRDGAVRLFNQRLAESAESSTNVVRAVLAGLQLSNRRAASADKAEAECPLCGPSGNPALCLSVTCPMRPEHA